MGFHRSEIRDAATSTDQRVNPWGRRDDSREPSKGKTGIASKV